MKFVIVVFVVVLVLWLMLGRKPAARRTGAPPADGPKRVAGPEGMVACAHCGVHLPLSESLPAPGGERYCCASHRDAGPRA